MSKITQHSHDVFPRRSEEDVREDKTETGQWFLMTAVDLQPTDPA